MYIFNIVQPKFNELLPGNVLFITGGLLIFFGDKNQVKNNIVYVDLKFVLAKSSMRNGQKIMIIEIPHAFKIL